MFSRVRNGWVNNRRDQEGDLGFYSRGGAEDAEVFNLELKNSGKMFVNVPGGLGVTGQGEAASYYDS